MALVREMAGTGATRYEIADLASTSQSRISAAMMVLHEAPALAARVEAGELSFGTACRVVRAERAGVQAGVPRVLTVREAAATLRVAPMTIYRLVNLGELAAHRIAPRCIRIAESALREHLARTLISPGGLTGRDIRPGDR